MVATTFVALVRVHVIGPSHPVVSRSIKATVAHAAPPLLPQATFRHAAQREDLELERGSRSEAGAERGDEGEENCLHEAGKPPHLSQHQARVAGDNPRSTKPR